MLSLIFFSCQPSEKSPTDSALIATAQPESTEPSPSAEDSDSQDSASSNEDTADPDDQPTSPPASVVRFVAMGDGGEGNTAQYENGQAVADLCAAKSDDRAGCDFVLYLGDNFYDAGVESVNDNQFNLKFEYPYEPLDIPFYVVLGNHDYGGCVLGTCGTGWDFELSQYQVEYTNYSDKWTMPAEYYTFVKEHVTFFGLDTNALMWDPWYSTAEDQYPWMEEELARATSGWKIAFGHHPYISNGRHGNAGTYEGLDWLAEWSIADVPLGAGVKDFMDQHICGQVDLYLAGHDHNRQWLEPTCGTEFIVSGAAAKLTPLENRGNPTFFEDDQLEGFVWIEIRDECLTGAFYNYMGILEFEQTYCRD